MKNSEERKKMKEREREKRKKMRERRKKERKKSLKNCSTSNFDDNTRLNSFVEVVIVSTKESFFDHSKNGKGVIGWC